MIRVEVDGLAFEFPDDWIPTKYDEWSFYRDHFIKVRDGIKAIDVLAVAPDGGAWLIEAKDYRANPRTKPSEPSDEVVQKVLDTLAALLPARLHPAKAEEQRLASAVLRAPRLRVVLHLEQPKKQSRLFPRAIDPAHVEQKLRQRLRPIDAHPKVTESGAMRGVPWQVK
jgi:hypothetical protein